MTEEGDEDEEEEEDEGADEDEDEEDEDEDEDAADEDAWQYLEALLGPCWSPLGAFSVPSSGLVRGVLGSYWVFVGGCTASWGSRGALLGRS